MTDISIGYDGVDLGITNQKIAILGLAHKGLRENKKINIPPLVVYDLSSESRKRVNFFEIFEEKPFRDILDSFSIRTGHPHEAIHAVDGWQLFLEGADRFGEVYRIGDVALDDLTCRLTGAFIPTKRVLDVSSAIKTSLSDLGIQHVIQMRIEKDWEGYSANVLTTYADENNLPTATEILRRSKVKFGENFSSAFILCDEGAMPMPKDEIRKIALDNHGIKLFWKSDFIEINDYNPLILSLVDFDIGMASPHFVGTSRSTFSCFVTFEKFCKIRKNIKNHYIYNGPFDDLKERFDNGTTVESRAAVEKTWERPDLLGPSAQDLSFPMALTAHVSNLGEYVSQNRVVRGIVRSKLVAGDTSQPDRHRIEGFSIEVSPEAPRLRYRSQGLGGLETAWMSGGDYSGSKGAHRPLAAFAIAIDGPASLALDCVYAGLFSDSDEIVVAANGEECRSSSGRGELLCMQVAIRKKSGSF
ncbi:O-fucosyltransferase family protein [Acidomonas methanolica]|uniref:O-fucosyltransferase family protein n=1 Tax=Acidomonas methanolica TaxID=437 RepID=UPI00211A2A15|nr:O-fucosyltransferase family protein [Acidomonas methanolica]MCQ9157063.1 O-fucosyltransferase family protein [Acidomonas methanolica]